MLVAFVLFAAGFGIGYVAGLSDPGSRRSRIDRTLTVRDRGEWLREQLAREEDERGTH